MSVLGLGHDVVDVSAFAEQLAEPGSRMRGLFSVREVRQAGERARNAMRNIHLRVVEERIVGVAIVVRRVGHRSLI